MPDNVVLLGLGSKARNGKDSTANFIKEFEPNVHIIHWADKLYEEVKNKDFGKHRMPLIYLDRSTKTVKILQSYKQEQRTSILKYDTFTFKELPEFALFMNNRATNYNYMIGKDPELLQIWGTNLRRNYFGNNYWVDRGFEAINQIVWNNQNYDGLIWICVADTRFRNEAAAIREAGGLYVDIIRLNENDTRFIAPDRDPNHPSEADLNDTKPDMTISAYGLDTLSTKVKDFILTIKRQRQI